MATMILWVIFALMTAAAIFAVVWPLGRPHGAAGGGNDLRVYKDQLKEIDSDRAAGLIGEVEAEAARLEIARRLLAAADAPEPQLAAPVAPAAERHRTTAVAIVLLLGLGPLGLYVALGSPN